MTLLLAVPLAACIRCALTRRYQPGRYPKLQLPIENAPCKTSTHAPLAYPISAFTPLFVFPLDTKKAYTADTYSPHNTHYNAPPKPSRSRRKVLYTLKHVPRQRHAHDDREWHSPQMYSRSWTSSFSQFFTQTEPCNIIVICPTGSHKPNSASRSRLAVPGRN